MALFRKRLLLAKSEGSSYGVSAAPTGADALLISNLDVSPLEVDLKDRELIRPYFGNSAKVVSKRMGSVKFDVELAGSGTAGTAPKWGRLLMACGFVEAVSAGVSVTYAPVSSGITSVTLDFNADGTKHLYTGCRGTASLSLKTGEIPKISFEFMGIYNAAAASAASTPTFDNQSAPVIANAQNTTAVSAFSFSSCMEEFTMALNNNTPFRQLMGCSQQIPVTDRLPSGEITIESPALGSKDFFGLVSGQTQGAITWQHGQTAGNIITFNAPTCSLGNPSYADSDGVMMLKMPYTPIPSSSGNDEFTLVLT